MIRYSSVVTIDRPPGDVFAALLDADLYGEWTEMVDTRFEGPGQPSVGTRGQFRFPTGPLKGRYDMEVVALEPGRTVDIRVDGAWLRWLSHVSLEPDGDGTQMTYAGEVSLLSWRRILEPVMAREVQAGEAHEAERFKELLESETAFAPGTASA